MGFLKYINHDSQRERPIYFHWEILDFDHEKNYVDMMALHLQAAPDFGPANVAAPFSDRRPPPSDSLMGLVEGLAFLILASDRFI